ncbi:MAG: flagellar basal body P-ring protein FlgI, partial [Planctomycetota bacterium]
MMRYDVKSPNQILELSDTAMVQVKGLIPPGAQRGDQVDLIVTLPPRSEASDLHGGWLLETRMRHQQRIGTSVHQSEILAIGTGAVITRDDTESSDDQALKTRGRILSGGYVQSDRSLGLVLRPAYAHVKLSARIAQAINERFYFFDGTSRRGIAKAIEDDFIEIEVHPRYRDNVGRLMEVVRSIGIEPKIRDPQARLVDLGQRLADPATAAEAAIELEAIGESAVPTLLEGVESNNPELRFYAAEALAYLDRNESIEPLSEAATRVAAFRYPALTALQGLEQHLAAEALRDMTEESSLETRYGAFRAMRRRSDSRLHLSSLISGSSFGLYRVASQSKPAIVVSTRRDPEIVLFGSLNPLSLDSFLMGTAGIMVKHDPDHAGQIRLSRFESEKSDRFSLQPATVRGLIDGVVAVGGGYSDVVAMLKRAKSKSVIVDPLAFDPIPKPMRTYYRDEVKSADTE